MRRLFFYAWQRQSAQLLRVHRFERQVQRDLFVELVPYELERGALKGRHVLVRRARSYAAVAGAEWPVAVLVKSGDLPELE